MLNIYDFFVIRYLPDAAHTIKTVDAVKEEIKMMEW